MKNSKRLISALLIICIVGISFISFVTIASAATLVTGSVSDGMYYIQHVGSQKYLDITDESMENGARLQIWTRYPKHSNQVFMLRKIGDYYKITAYHSQKCIEVRNSSKENGAHVAQWSYSNIACQQWKIIRNSDGTFSFCNRNSGKYLDVSGNGTQNGTKLIQYSKNGTTAQKFKLYELDVTDVLNAKWTRTFANSDISWTQYSINSNVYNLKRFSNGRKFPTPNRTYLEKVEYLDRKTVHEILIHNSLNQSILDQIKDAIYSQGKEKVAELILKSIGFKNLPGLGLAVSVCEILYTSSSQKDWNNFVKAIKYDNYGGTGVVKKTYVTITLEPRWGPLNNGTTAWGWNYYLIETKSYQYASWNGNGGITAPNYSGKWTLNFK